VREAIAAHAAAGKGLVLLHPGLWYNWANWPAYNRELAGGGSRGHDAYGEFEVMASGVKHPLMQGVPENFKLSDELYYYEADPAGTPIQVLATARSKSKNKDFPQVFVVNHPKARIAGVTMASPTGMPPTSSCSRTRCCGRPTRRPGSRPARSNLRA
jgi:type 1 glutamine amidotransferase